MKIYNFNFSVGVLLGEQGCLLEPRSAKKKKKNIGKTLNDNQHVLVRAAFFHTGLIVTIPRRDNRR